MTPKYDIAFEECLGLAKKAKALRTRAKIAEEKAVEKFRQVRYEIVEKLHQEKEELQEKEKALREESPKLPDMFCIQNGEHSYVCHEIQARTQPHIYFPKRIYYAASYKICLICGHAEPCTPLYSYTSNSPMHHHRSNLLLRSEEELQKEAEDLKADIATKRTDVINEASNQDENPELKRTAQRLLEIPEESLHVNDRLKQINEELQEICRLFGHNAEKNKHEYDRYTCKCCGKIMTYDEYLYDCRKIEYRGGIVPSLAGVCSPILD